MLQSNAEEVIRRELRNAAGAAIDAAVMGGSGSFGEPLGIKATPGVGTTSGSTLGTTGITAAQVAVGNANAVLNRDTLGWATTPTVAGVLKARQRFTGTDSPIWLGDANDGQIDGKRALSTTGAPASTAIYGDWSSATIYAFEAGAELFLDPFTSFQTGIVTARLLIPIDIALRFPGAFVQIPSVT